MSLARVAGGVGASRARSGSSSPAGRRRDRESRNWRHRRASRGRPARGHAMGEEGASGATRGRRKTVLGSSTGLPVPGRAGPDKAGGAPLSTGRSDGDEGPRGGSHPAPGAVGAFVPFRPDASSQTTRCVNGAVGGYGRNDVKQESDRGHRPRPDRLSAAAFIPTRPRADCSAPKAGRAALAALPADLGRRPASLLPTFPRPVSALQHGPPFVFTSS